MLWSTKGGWIAGHRRPCPDRRSSARPQRPRYALSEVHIVLLWSVPEMFSYVIEVRCSCKNDFFLFQSQNVIL